MIWLRGKRMIRIQCIKIYCQKIFKNNQSYTFTGWNRCNGCGGRGKIQFCTLGTLATKYGLHSSCKNSSHFC